jgi:hypothetical protein
MFSREYLCLPTAVKTPTMLGLRLLMRLCPPLAAATAASAALTAKALEEVACFRRLPRPHLLTRGMRMHCNTCGHIRSLTAATRVVVSYCARRPCSCAHCDHGMRLLDSNA